MTKVKIYVEECFYFSYQIFNFTVNYIYAAIGLTWLLPSCRIKISDKPIINKARTHNSSRIKTRLPVYRKLNLSLRISTNGSHNRFFSEGKNPIVFLSNSIINTNINKYFVALSFFFIRQFPLPSQKCTWI